MKHLLKGVRDINLKFEKTTLTKLGVFVKPFMGVFLSKNINFQKLIQLFLIHSIIFENAKFNFLNAFI
jgi:hypothetical protein